MNKYILELLELEAAVVHKEAEQQEVLIPLKRLEDRYVLAWHVNTNEFIIIKEKTLIANDSMYIHHLKKEVVEVLGIGI